MSAIDQKLIRDISDFPKVGITFKDITPLLADAQNFSDVIELFSTKVATAEFIVGIEARGFVFAAALAKSTKRGFIPIRKSGKLPGDTESQNYQLEYGLATMEIHKGLYPTGSSVLIVDDVLATGGTAIAAIELCEKIGLKVQSLAFLLEIPGLGGRSQINKKYPNLQIHVLLGE